MSGQPSLIQSRNVVDEETAALNRERRAGSYTFHAPLPDDYSGIAFTLACVRIGDHAHVHVESGRARGEVQTNHVFQIPTRGFAGKLVLRWPEWLLLRDVLADHPAFYIAEVETPTLEMAKRYAGDRP